ncbi:MAG: hypothetical protein HOK75_05500 [Phycisphaerae bacterium]|nr:hypothetical protein [Phycisphaerae bacterium]
MSRKKIKPWFKNEANAVVGIDACRASQDWTALAKHIQDVCTARMQRADASRNGAKVQIVQSREDIENLHDTGRYLFQPPLVARDAAMFDNAMKSNGVSVVVACREPKTSLGLCPVVALGSGVTTRVQIEEPKNPTKPTCSWFDHALEELGNHILEQMNKESASRSQLDYLLAHIPASPTHTGLYNTAIALCETLVRDNG